MIRTVLQMRYTPHPLRPVAAWFVASPDASDWLQVATRCFVSCTGEAVIEQSRIRILPIPRSRHQREPAGALVLPGSDAGDEIPQTCHSVRCLPYGRYGRRLFLPVESRLEPAITADELECLLAEDLTYVWHPVIGLVALEAKDVLPMADLIQVDLPVTGQWDRAQPGEMLPTRLHAVAPIEPPTLGMILQSGQDDIGSESDEISALPPTQDEPRPGISNSVKRAALSALAGGVAGLASFAKKMRTGGAESTTGARGGLSGESHWLDRMTEWTQKRLEHLNKALLSKRDKEINRLLRMLETDPDQGLKYALPIGGDAHRGVAAPTSQLTRRNTEFSLGGLGGGGAADRWNLSWEGQQRLTIRYRELANRELHLGRHRRAAYIFAELLGDFAAAASALKQGKYWREAAVLYRSRLNRPLEAAECLQQGGLWTEACEAYVELKEHEKAGDIFAHLQQSEEARAQYRLAVLQSRSRSNWLGSAKLLETKLDAVEEAIEELSAAWPYTGQSVACLHALFALLGRLGRHQAAVDKIQQLRDAETPQRSRLSLVETLADTATDYPDRDVRAASADSARVLASRMITHGLPFQSTRLLQAVRRLAPDDRLLSRDCLRFERQRDLDPPLPAAKQRSGRGSPTLVRSISLPSPESTWQAEAAIASGGVVFVAGRTNRGSLHLYRFGWNGDAQHRLSWSRGLAGTDLIMAANPNRPESLLVHSLGGDLVMPVKKFPETEDCPSETAAGAVPGMTSGLLAASVTGEGMTWVLEQRGHAPTLLAVMASGDIAHSRSLAQFQEELFPYLDNCQRVPMHASRRVYLGAGSKMIIIERGEEATTVEFDDRITSIVGSLPNTRPRVAAALQGGGVISWGSFEDDQRLRFASDLVEPLLTFNRGGLLIAAEGRRCEVYSTRGERIDRCATLDLPSPAVAVVSAVSPNQFGILLKPGLLNLYQIE